MVVGIGSLGLLVSKHAKVSQNPVQAEELSYD